MPFASLSRGIHRSPAFVVKTQQRAATALLAGGGVNGTQVTFPAGSDWVYLFDKTQIHAGGSTATLTVPLAQYPVFIKHGSGLLATWNP